MKKMGLMVNNFQKDHTKVSAMEGSAIKVLGFIPLKLRVKEQEGQVYEAKECLYFVVCRGSHDHACLPRCTVVPIWYL